MQAVKNTTPTELRIWERLNIIVGEGRDAGVYETRVEDIINGGVVVNNPEFISGHTLLRNDVAVVVQLTREDAAYQFHSRIRMHNTDNVRHVILAPPKSFQRVQRRMFARVEYPAHVLYASAPADGNWENWTESAGWQESFAVDISAGGMQLKTVSQLAKDAVIFLRVRDFAESDVPSCLVALCRRGFTREGQAYAGVEFQTADDLPGILSQADLHGLPAAFKSFNRRAQDRLASFLFHKQIELRQKGLI